MKHFFFTVLPLLLFLGLAPGQSYACGKHCEKKEVQKAAKSSCCAQSTGAANAGAAIGSHDCSQDDHDCGGDCGGKCGGHCNCPCAHSGAVVTGELILCLSQPEPEHTGFPYTTPFLSNVSLDIWLPPNIRA